jgi:hypothetical protein
MENRKKRRTATNESTFPKQSADTVDEGRLNLQSGTANQQEIQSAGGHCTMSEKNAFSKLPVAVLLAIALGSLVSSTGCQTSVAGQTLPSPFYLYDDVQYFPAGPENKLANETAALKAARAEARSAQQRR